jgi:vanillate O-demethylase monooxygenase subunit
MFLQNCWYVAAWEHELKETPLLARTIIGQPVVLYKAANGTPVAMADRCCHRLAPLSRGRLEGDNVRCMYHGLLYAPDGACIEIPGQKAIPRIARVKTFAVAARNKLIWIWMGDAVSADRSLIPDTYALDHPDWRYRPGYVRFGADYRYILDNLLDFSHLSYVHAATLGGSDLIAKAKAEVEPFEDGVRIRRLTLNSPQPPFAKPFLADGTNVDRWHHYEIRVPGIMSMDSGIQATGTGVPEGVRNNALEFRAYNLVTPETERTSHYFFALAHNFAIDDPSTTEKLHAEVSKAFAEDEAMIEAQQRAIDETPDLQMVVIPADTALVQMRRILEAKLARERSTADAV